MRLVIVAVGKEYIEEAIPHVEKFSKNGWEIDILTDEIESFKSGNLYEYVNKIFFFNEKILFPLRMCEKYKEDIIVSDIDFLENLNDEFIGSIKNNGNVLYVDHWKMKKEEGWIQWTTIKESDHPYFNPLFNFLKEDDIETMVEWCFFIPYSEKIENVIHEVEKFKSILEYMSVMGEQPDKLLGGGEGLSFSYALKKNGIKTQKFIDN